jgi:hypothetical protein
MHEVLHTHNAHGELSRQQKQTGSQQHKQPSLFVNRACTTLALLCGQQQPLSSPLPP